MKDLEEIIEDMLKDDVHCYITIIKHKGVHVLLTNTPDHPKISRTFRPDEVGKIVPWIQEAQTRHFQLRDLFTCFTIPSTHPKPKR